MHPDGMGYGLAQDLNISDYTNWAAAGSQVTDSTLATLLPIQGIEGSILSGPLMMMLEPGGAISAPSSGSAGSGGSSGGTVAPFSPSTISATTWLVVGGVVLLLLVSMSSGPARYGR